MTTGPGNSPTHSSRSSLKTLITKVPLGTAATFGKVGAKTYTKAEGSRRGANEALLHPSRSAEAGFLALTHLSPSAHAGTSAGHR